MSSAIWPTDADLTAAELARIERAYRREQLARELVIAAVGALVGSAATLLWIFWAFFEGRLILK